MQYFTNSIRFSAKSILLSLGLTLVACGGGGGGGGQQPISYSGNTNQANIDANQAEEITDAYVNANEQNVGAVTGAIISSTSGNTSQRLSERSTNFLMEKLKQDALSSINSISTTNSSDNTNTTFTAAIAVPDFTPGTTIPGDCSANGVTAVPDGAYTSSLLSQSDTLVSVQLNYTNYCTYDTFDNSYLVVNGSITASATGSNLLNQNALLNSLTMDAPNFAITYTDSTESYSLVISQKYSFTFLYDGANNHTGTTAKLSTDVGYNGLVYRFEIEANLDNIGTATQTIYRFYHPTYGYVEYDSTLTFGCADGSPDGGTLTITGSNAAYVITPSGSCDGQYTIQ